MVVFCYFGAKTLRQACIIIAAFYTIVAVWDIISSLVYITRGWVFILVLVEALVSLPFHVLLFFGAKKERATWVQIWLGYTLIVTFPAIIIRLGVAFYYLFVYWLLTTILHLVFRVWMWFRVRTFYYQLVNKGSNNTPTATTNNPITPVVVTG